MVGGACDGSAGYAGGDVGDIECTAKAVTAIQYLYETFRKKHQSKDDVAFFGYSDLYLGEEIG